MAPSSHSMSSRGVFGLAVALSLLVLCPSFGDGFEFPDTLPTWWPTSWPSTLPSTLWGYNISSLPSTYNGFNISTYPFPSFTLPTLPSLTFTLSNYTLSELLNGSFLVPPSLTAIPSSLIPALPAPDQIRFPTCVNPRPLEEADACYAYEDSTCCTQFTTLLIKQLFIDRLEDCTGVTAECALYYSALMCIPCDPSYDPNNAVCPEFLNLVTSACSSAVCGTGTSTGLSLSLPSGSVTGTSSENCYNPYPDADMSSSTDSPPLFTAMTSPAIENIALATAPSILCVLVSLLVFL